MELLNPGFVILLIKITISVMPGVIGVTLIASSEETKRKIRSWVCNKLFGVSNAFEYKKFARFLVIVGILGLLVSSVFSWFLLIAPMLQEPTL